MVAKKISTYAYKEDHFCTIYSRPNIQSNILTLDVKTWYIVSVDCGDISPRCTFFLRFLIKPQL